MSTLEPWVITSGCFLHISHPTWEKKKPLLALYGSAFVSVTVENIFISLDYSGRFAIESFYIYDEYDDL
jgi:hypothetical protein